MQKVALIGIMFAVLILIAIFATQQKESVQTTAPAQPATEVAKVEPKPTPAPTPAPVAPARVPALPQSQKTRP